MKVYRLMQPHFASGAVTFRRPAKPYRGVSGTRPVNADGKRRPAVEADPTTSPVLLVARLRDGNPHVPANNLVVNDLMGIGVPALQPLMVAMEDEAFPGRGYAAWALAMVLRHTGSQDPAAHAALAKAAQSGETYLRLLAKSGLDVLAGRK